MFIRTKSFLLLLLLYIVALLSTSHTESVLSRNWHGKSDEINVDSEMTAVVVATALQDKYFIIFSAGFIDRRELLQITQFALQLFNGSEKKNFFPHHSMCVCL